MTRFGYGMAGLVAIALAAVVGWHERVIEPEADRQAAAADRAASVGHGATALPGAPTLYCEFTNFADRNPRVGFYFAIQDGQQPPVYAQIFQRERDGTQADFGGDGQPRPEWAFDGSADPAVLRAPDDSIAINLYDYDPRKRSTAWFEAGLRSIRYLNLGGRCRRSAA